MLNDSTLIFLGFGSNLGDAQAQFNAACEELAGVFHLKAHSSLYKTKPFGFTDQPDFTNAVVAGTSELEPLDLLEYMQGIERRLGKRFLHLNGPRCIDLDLLFYGDTVLHQDDVHIPHASAHARDFVLRPLAEIAPDFVHPEKGKTVRELITNLTEIYFTGQQVHWQR